jgi:hypothetical protein
MCVYVCARASLQWSQEEITKVGLKCINIGKNEKVDHMQKKPVIKTQYSSSMK